MTNENRNGRPVASVRGGVALAIGIASLTTVHAQQTPDPSSSSSIRLEEVTVTATRKEESLSKVPISVSVLTQEAMQDKGIKDIRDVVRFTPGVTVDLTGTNNIAIRGISSTGGAGTTGIYIDDVPMQVRNFGGTADSLVKIFDLDRIEVLRGPQGTLFGAGSEGGTVRYITTQPSLTESSLSARAESSFTQGGSLNYEVGVGGGAPLIDGKLGVRGSVWYRRDGGWIDRLDPLSLQKVAGDENRDETVAAHLSAVWRPTDTLKIAPSIFYQDRDRNAPTSFWPILSDPDSDRYVNADPTSRTQPDRFYLPSLNIEQDFGPVRLISTTSYLDRKSISGGDSTLFALSLFQSYVVQFGANTSVVPLIDGNGYHIPPDLVNDYQATTTGRNTQRNFTQELRLQSTDPDARLTWTAGVFFTDNRQVSDSAIFEPGVDPLFMTLFGGPFWAVFSQFPDQVIPSNPDGTTILPDGNSYTDRLETRDKQIAGFGEANVKLTNELKLTLGVRAGKSEVHLDEVSGGAQPNGGFTNASKQSEKPVTPKVGLAYQMNRDNLFYTTFAKGFRPGGGNPDVPFISCQPDFDAFGIPGAPRSYNADTVKSFEVGSKNNFSDRVRLAASAFYIEWEDIQQLVTPPSCGIAWTQNMGKAVSKGFDLQADVAVTEALKLELAVGYTDARYTESAFVGAAIEGVLPVVSDGNAVTDANGLPIVPWTVALGADYRFNAFSFPSFVRLDYQYSGSEKYNPAALDQGTLQYGFGAATYYQALRSWRFATLRAGMTRDNWSTSLFVDNLLNTNTTLTSRHSTPTFAGDGSLVASPLFQDFTFRPRTFGISATYRF